jgi:hypothetical protein
MVRHMKKHKETERGTFQTSSNATIFVTIVCSDCKAFRFTRNSDWSYVENGAIAHVSRDCNVARKEIAHIIARKILDDSGPEIKGWQFIHS